MNQSLQRERSAYQEAVYGGIRYIPSFPKVTSLYSAITNHRQDMVNMTWVFKTLTISMYNDNHYNDNQNIVAGLKSQDLAKPEKLIQRRKELRSENEEHISESYATRYPVKYFLR